MEACLCNRNLIPEIGESSGLTGPAKSPQIGVTNSLKWLQAPKVGVTSARYRVSRLIHFLLAGRNTAEPGPLSGCQDG